MINKRLKLGLFLGIDHRSSVQQNSLNSRLKFQQLQNQILVSHVWVSIRSVFCPHSTQLEYFLIPFLSGESLNLKYLPFESVFNNKVTTQFMSLSVSPFLSYFVWEQNLLLVPMTYQRSLEHKHFGSRVMSSLWTKWWMFLSCLFLVKQ